MPIEVDFQTVVDKYARALNGPSRLFSLWPGKRGPGKPAEKYSALCSAVVLGVTGAFEAFAEDLLAAALIRQGHGWAQVAANADLTNPSLKTLREKLSTSAGIDVISPPGWSVKLPIQSGTSTAWKERPVEWGEVLARSASWIEVRHCLAHGVVTGLGAERWPGPVNKGKHDKVMPTANDDNILAKVARDPAVRGLFLWPTVSCARTFSSGAAVIASTVAEEFGETVDVSRIPDFAKV